MKLHLFLVFACLHLWASAFGSSPAMAVDAAWADAVKLNAKLKPHEIENFRYFWLPQKTQLERITFGVVFQGHWYLLSQDSLMGESRNPVRVTSYLVRVDLRNYKFKRVSGGKKFTIAEVLEKAKDVDPYFHVKIAKIPKKTPKRRGKLPAPKKVSAAAPWLPAEKIAGLIDLLQTEVPVLRADWFFVQSARQISLRNQFEGLGYYDFHGIKNRRDFLALTGTSRRTAERIYREWRAAIPVSGVSQQNRQIVGYGAASGRVWFTLDTFDMSDRGIAIRNLLKGEFKHDAEEAYGFLPNNLPLTGLFAAADGAAQESAPDKIGGDRSALNTSRDMRIHINLACMRCHAGDVLQPVKCGVRDLYRVSGPFRLQSKDREVSLELERQYFSDVDRLLQRDREEFQYAFRLATKTPWTSSGLSSAQFAKFYARAWDRYVEDAVTLDDAARELGCTPDHLYTMLWLALRKTGSLDPVLERLIDRPRKGISRLEFEDVYALTQTHIRGLVLFP